ncbi:MAG TPA: LptF/LptG family permease [Candidatus Acidoferrales bacterium]|nr:LptF/LptG family permease [Candidatus Acidoferrales bacterium]
MGRVRLSILDSYILRELVPPFIFAFGAFFLFWAFSLILSSFDFLINQHAPIFLVLRFVILRIPQSLSMAFPFATLFAALLAMGRLIGDHEVIAMRTSGITLWRLCITPLLFGATCFVLALVSDEYITPKAVALSERTFYQIIYRTASIPLQPQFFNKDPDTGNVFYVGQISHDGKTMEDVRIFKPGKTTPWNETWEAKTATIDESKIVLNDILQTRYNNDGYETSQSHIKQVTMGLPLGDEAAQFTQSMNSESSSMNAKQMESQVRQMQSQGVGGSTLGTMQVQLADKVAYPFAAFVSVLIALPLAIRFGKRGRMLAMAIAILTFFIYYMLTFAFSAFGRNGVVNPTLAAWAPNVIIGALGIILLLMEERVRWFFGSRAPAKAPGTSAG